MAFMRRDGQSMLDTNIPHFSGWAGAPCVSVRQRYHVAFPVWRPQMADPRHTPPAGGAAYYFAKQSINADRQSRLEQQRRKKAVHDSLEYGGADAAALNGGPARTDTAGSPSQESSSDPAPTRHAPTTEGQRVFEKSKYESSAPFRSSKGDRFS